MRVAISQSLTPTHKHTQIEREEQRSNARIHTFITKSLRHICRLGHGLDEHEVVAMVNAVDANHDGNVTFDEFVHMVQKLPAYA